MTTIDEIFNKTKFIKNYNSAIEQFDEIEILAKDIKSLKLKRVFFVGSGGAYTKFVNMRPLIFETFNVPFIITSPEELLSLYLDNLNNNSLIIFGTKTGKTNELIKALNHIKLKNKKPMLIGFVGDVDTEVEEKIDFHRINSIDTDVHLIVFGWLLVLINRDIDTEIKVSIKKELELAGIEIAKKIDSQKKNLSLQIDKSDINSKQMWIGSGRLWGEICCYTNYILEEIQWIFSQPIHSSEFFHGPFELVEDNFVPNLVLNTDDNRRQDLRVKSFIEKFSNQFILIDMNDYLFEYKNLITKEIVEPYILNHIFDTMLNKYTKMTGKSVSTRRYYRKIDY